MKGHLLRSMVILAKSMEIYLIHSQTLKLTRGLQCKAGSQVIDCKDGRNVFLFVVEFFLQLFLYFDHFQPLSYPNPSPKYFQGPTKASVRLGLTVKWRVLNPFRNLVEICTANYFLRLFLLNFSQRALKSFQMNLDKHFE